jgi:cell division septal protein FtsQ
MFLKNKKKSRLKVFFRFLLFIAFIFLVCGILYLLIYSNVLNVKTFEFQYSSEYHKEETVPEDEAGKASIFYTNDFLASSLSSQIIKERKNLGYLGSDNILFWFLGKKENLVNNNILPSVEQINLDVDLFDRKVKVLVEEKELSGIICKPEKLCFAFDKSGRIFASAPFVKGSLIFRIDDTNDRPLVFGEKFLSKEKWINNILKTIKIIKESGFNIKSSAIREMDLSEWEVVISDGPKLLFSLNFVPGDLQEIIKTLKERADFSDISYFDMRVENRIYYK